MEIDYDPAKNAKNLRERGLSFDSVVDFDFSTATFVIDTRREYGEVRWRALGQLHGRLHALVFTQTPVGVRVISFRKANRREVQRYEQATQP